MAGGGKVPTASSACCRRRRRHRRTVVYGARKEQPASGFTREGWKQKASEKSYDIFLIVRNLQCCNAITVTNHAHSKFRRERIGQQQLILGIAFFPRQQHTAAAAVARRR